MTNRITNCGSSTSYEKMMEDNNKCTMVIIPRNLFNKQIDNKLLTQNPCFYILLKDNKMPTQGYAGYTNDPIERITTHKNKKNWWSYALLFLYHDKDPEGKDFHFDIADVAYLEYLALNKPDAIIKGLRFKNKKKADKQYLKPYTEKYIQKAFDSVKLLISEYFNKQNY